jgi:hypothetical protein
MRLHGDDDAGLTVESLLDAIEGCADWRSRTAAEHPGDPRHSNAAAALYEVAAWVRAHPDDPGVRAIVAVQAVNRDLDLTWPISGQSGHLLSRHGFAFEAAQPPPVFLERLADALTDDVSETRKRDRIDERERGRLDES